MPTTSHVYVISAGNATVKVGIAQNPEIRKQFLQAGHYEPLKVAFSHASDKKESQLIERFAHQILVTKRLQGEWFSVTVEEAKAAILEAIARVQAGEKPPPYMWAKKKSPQPQGCAAKSQRKVLGKYMLTVSSQEYQRNLGKYYDVALTEPIVITHNGRERLVVLSAEAFRQMQRHTREVLPVEALSDADLAAIAAAEVPAEYAYLDRELDPRP
jgi:prevent-host-death family protein